MLSKLIFGVLGQQHCLLWAQTGSLPQLEVVLFGKVHRPIPPRRFFLIQQTDALQRLGHQLRAEVAAVLPYIFPIKITLHLQQFHGSQVIFLAQVLLHEGEQGGLGLGLADVVEFPQSYLTVEVEVGYVLLPVVYGHSVHLIAFKHHKVFLLQTDHHCHMVEVAVCEETLNLCSKILGIEQKNISCFCCFQKLTLGEDVLTLVGEFVDSLEHYFVFLGVENQDLGQDCAPCRFLTCRLCLKEKILTFASEVQQQSFFVFFEYGRQYSQIYASNSFFLSFILKAEQLLTSKHDVSLMPWEEEPIGFLLQETLLEDVVWIGEICRSKWFALFESLPLGLIEILPGVGYFFFQLDGHGVVHWLVGDIGESLLRWVYLPLIVPVVLVEYSDFR